MNRGLKKVVFDNDLGIDDAQALTYLVAHSDVDLIAVTMVAGNACMNTISENALKVLSYLNVTNIPVYKAGCFNLNGKHIDSDGYFGPNAFADIELPPSTININTQMASAEALVYYAHKYPKEITFLFCGPLTNLALAFFIDNEYPNLVGSITIVGSDRSEKTIKMPSDYAEFNAISDPVSYRVLADCLSKMDVQIQIIDWTTIYTNLLPFTLIEKLHEYVANNPNSFTDKSNKYLIKNFWDKGFLTGDLWAALGLTHPEIFLEKKRSKISKVYVEGDLQGHVEYENDDKSFIDLVVKIDTEKASQILLYTFCRKEN